MKANTTVSMIGVALVGIALAWGCSKTTKAVDNNNVTIRIERQNPSRVVLLNEPATPQDKERLQSEIAKLRNGDRVSILGPKRGYIVRGPEYVIEEKGDAFRVLRVGPGEERLEQISGSAERKDLVLQLFAEHVERDAKTIKGISEPSAPVPR